MMILRFHLALAPPSTAKAIPVTHSASGAARNNTQWATSWEVPNRGQGKQVNLWRVLCLALTPKNQVTAAVTANAAG
jgi:hypothetical protein